MRTFTLTSMVAMATACLTNRVAAQGNIYDFQIFIDPSSAQISEHEVIFSPNGPIKTVWDPGNVSVSPTTLHFGDILTFDFNLAQALRATDLAANPDTTEMIFWAVSGSGTLPIAESMQYEWQFLSTSGALLSTTITGGGVLRSIPGQVQGVINTSQTFRTLNLTDSSFTFSGLRLTMTVPSISSGWTINSVRSSFAADDIQIVPEPAFGSLAGLCMVVLAFARFRQRCRP